MACETLEDIVTNEELIEVWGNASFGSMTKRNVVKLGVLKCASGYHQGHTSKSICQELGLITKEYDLTAKGRVYLWEVFKGDTVF